jgi:hypothetical protein
VQFKEGEISVSVPRSNYPEHTKKFISLLTRMVNKGLDNPAYQLHTLSIICTGKSFIELITRNTADVEHMIQAARALAEGLLDVVVQSSDSSGITVDELLNRMGKNPPAEEE